jgi:hypothetical protein
MATCYLCGCELGEAIRFNDLGTLCHHCTPCPGRVEHRACSMVEGHDGPCVPRCKHLTALKRCGRDRSVCIDGLGSDGVCYRGAWPSN